MKSTTKLLNLLTAFLAVIGVCAATLVCFIVAYTQINGGFSPKRTTDYNTVVAQTDNNTIRDFSFSAELNDNFAPESLSDTDASSNNSNTEPISLTENQTSNEISEQPTFEYDAYPAFSDTDYAVNIETGDTSDSVTYATQIEQGTSTAPPIEQNEPSVIYSSEVPIVSSSQIIDNSLATDNENNFNTHNIPESSAPALVTDTVWLSATGEKYHSIDHCGQMNPNKARQVSLEYAVSVGYDKCEKCF